MANKAQKSSGSALDLAMAAFAGTAAGFVVFAMPGWQFDRVVELSGLPLILPAAQPPLGMTARIAAVAAAAVGTWALVWLILRALSKKPPEPKRRAKPVEIDVPLPRIRRADAHPDAPARRPILAGLELGRPLDEQIGDATMEQGEAREAIAEGEIVEAAIADDEILPAGPLPNFMEAEEVAFEAEPADAPELPEILDAVPAQPSAAGAEQATIAHLMQRLELGLLRRERQDWSDPAGEADRREQPVPQLDHRLRSAIDDLQRLAARSG